MEDMNHIERLPEELKLQILGFLSYQDGLRLKQVNRYFHQNLSLRSWPDEKRALFVQGAQHWDKHNQSVVQIKSGHREIRTVTNGFACFGCFHVLPRENFSKSKTSRGYAKSSNKYVFKRLCLDCGVKQLTYNPGVVIESVTEEIINIAGGRAFVKQDCDRLILCGVCNNFSMFEVLSPPGRCQKCVKSRAYLLLAPMTSTDATQRCMMVVRCEICCAVQEVREPRTSHIECNRCFVEPRAFRKALKLHEKRVVKQELHHAKVVSMWEEDLDEDDVLLSLERLFLGLMD